MKSFREKVEATPTYKSLNSVQKEFASSKSNMKHLEDGVTIANNIGYDKWKQQSGYTERNANIVFDIINFNPAEPKIVPEQMEAKNVITFAQVQCHEVAKINSFNEWKEFISGRSTETMLLALSPSGHVIKSLHLMNDDNYPLTIYETMEPAVKKVDYQSLSNN